MEKGILHRILPRKTMWRFQTETLRRGQRNAIKQLRCMGISNSETCRCLQNLQQTAHDVHQFWVRIEDMKADVESFLFVPAMCIVLRELKWDGCPQRSQFENRIESPYWYHVSISKAERYIANNAGDTSY